MQTFYYFIHYPQDRRILKHLVSLNTSDLEVDTYTIAQVASVCVMEIVHQVRDSTRASRDTPNACIEELTDTSHILTSF